MPDFNLCNVLKWAVWVFCINLLKIPVPKLRSIFLQLNPVPFGASLKLIYMLKNSHNVHTGTGNSVILLCVVAMQPPDGCGACGFQPWSGSIVIQSSDRVYTGECEYFTMYIARRLSVCGVHVYQMFLQFLRFPFSHLHRIYIMCVRMHDCTRHHMSLDKMNQTV